MSSSVGGGERWNTQIAFQRSQRIITTLEVKIHHSRGCSQQLLDDDDSARNIDGGNILLEFKLCTTNKHTTCSQTTSRFPFVCFFSFSPSHVLFPSSSRAFPTPYTGQSSPSQCLQCLYTDWKSQTHRRLLFGETISQREFANLSYHQLGGFIHFLFLQYFVGWSSKKFNQQ